MKLEFLLVSVFLPAASLLPARLFLRQFQLLLRLQIVIVSRRVLLPLLGLDHLHSSG